MAIDFSAAEALDEAPVKGTLTIKRKAKPELKEVPKKAKPHYTAAQVRQYQEEQRLLAFKPEERKIEIDKSYAKGFKTDKGCEHEACRLGIYMGRFYSKSDVDYNRVCFRCRGLGYITTKQKANNYTRDIHAERGTSKFTVKDYDNEYAISSLMEGWDSVL